MGNCSYLLCCGVAEWLRHSVSNLVRSSRMGLNPIVGATNHRPTVTSSVHPSEVGKSILRGNLSLKAVIPQVYGQLQSLF